MGSQLTRNHSSSTRISAETDSGRRFNSNSKNKNKNENKSSDGNIISIHSGDRSAIIMLSDRGSSQLESMDTRTMTSSSTLRLSPTSSSPFSQLEAAEDLLQETAPLLLERPSYPGGLDTGNSSETSGGRDAKALAPPLSTFSLWSPASPLLPRSDDENVEASAAYATSRGIGEDVDLCTYEHEAVSATAGLRKRSRIKAVTEATRVDRGAHRGPHVGLHPAPAPDQGRLARQQSTRESCPEKKQRGFFGIFGMMHHHHPPAATQPHSFSSVLLASAATPKMQSREVGMEQRKSAHCEEDLEKSHPRGKTKRRGGWSRLFTSGSQSLNLKRPQQTTNGSVEESSGCDAELPHRRRTPAHVHAEWYALLMAQR